MQLDKLTVRLRERSSWEAMELGLVLIRKHAKMVWTVWFLLTTPIFIFLNITAYVLFKNFWVATLALWWLKPVFDRIPLLILSRAVFGDNSSVKELSKEGLRWGINLMWGHLLIRRLSPARALFLPADLLEGSHPSQRSKRRMTLGFNVYLNAALLMGAFMTFEIGLMIALNFGLIGLLPFDIMPHSSMAFLSKFQKEHKEILVLLTNISYWLVVSLLEPFYIAMGFGLYLNRRTQLEGWDLEITFRQLRQRLLSHSRSGLMAVFIGIMGILPLTYSVAYADDLEPPNNSKTEIEFNNQPENIIVAPNNPSNKTPVEPEEKEEKITQGEALFEDTISKNPEIENDAKAILANPMFGSQKTITEWKLKEPKSKNTQPYNPSPLSTSSPRPYRQSDWSFWENLIEGFVAFLKFLGSLSKPLLFLILIGLVFLLVRTYPRWSFLVQKYAVKETEKAKKSAIITSQAISNNGIALPKDILSRCHALWQQGKQRESLSLLYQASVQQLTQRANTPVQAGATELDFLILSKKLSKESEQQLYSTLISMWQHIAYAHQPPTAQDFQAIIQLFSQHYGKSL